jgi:hypothetical protein
MSQALHDRIGGTYTSTRRPDPRIAAEIVRDVYFPEIRGVDHGKGRR